MKYILSFLVLCYTLLLCAPAVGQVMDTLSVYTKKFKEYAPESPFRTSTVFRYNPLNRVTLEFRSYRDSIITAFVYDYDTRGNSTKTVKLQFVRDIAVPNKYVLRGSFDAKEFTEAIDKILKRLEEKR